METVFTLPSANPGCTGLATLSEDRCEVTSDVVCPDGYGGTIQAVSKEEWVADGARGTGAMSIVSINQYGSVTCQGSYDVTYEKL